ncbi:H+ symporter family protein, partial [Vibrio parahaemolyticus EKP-028]
RLRVVQRYCLTSMTLVSGWYLVCLRWMRKPH